MNIDPNLLEFCSTERQREILEVLIREKGNKTRAAKALSIERHYVRKVLKNVTRAAAEQGYSPRHGINHPLPDNLRLRGTSALVDERSGEVVLQWYKSSAKTDQAFRAVMAAAEEMATEIPREKPTPAPKEVIDDLMSVYVLTDFHLGMFADASESGEDWSTAKGEAMLERWIERATGMVPKSKVGVLAQLGDFMHFDGPDPVTSLHKNVLDADTRFQRMIQIAVRALRRIIHTMLDHHEEVIVILAEGNHDLLGSAWLRVMFHALFENEPRVFINDSPNPYYCIEHGDTSVFFHHGHLRKPRELPESLAAQFRHVLGRTKFSYAHTGHQHHSMVLESPLMVVEQHQTLAPKDAYSARLGHHAQRSSQVITYHRTQGEIGRIRLPAIALDDTQKTSVENLPQEGDLHGSELHARGAAV